MTCRLGVALFAVICAACGNKAEVARAKRSAYDTAFAIVYGKALEATREIYPNLNDNPGSGAIRTAWHQVSYANNQDDLTGNQSLSTAPGALAPNQGAAAAGMPTRLAYKRYFIRFDVTVKGPRPWRIKVVGHASEWEPGAALPSELVGAAKPSWLEGRTDALTLAIYKKLKQVAVAAKEEAPIAKRETVLPKTDPKAFANVPAAAAQRLADLKDAVAQRAYDRLRAQLFDDVVWNLGAAPGADTAIPIWQADPEPLEAMLRAIADGCAPTTDPKRVSCPAGDPQPGGWQLVLEHRGADWKVASFFKSE